MARWTSQLLIPFLEFTTCHMAINHLSNPMGESSMIVPVFRVNWGESCFSRHFQRLYASRKTTFFERHLGQVTPLGHRWATRYSRQLGQVTPLGHRWATRYSRQLARLAKNMIAS